MKDREDHGKTTSTIYPNFAGLRPRPSGRLNRGRDPHCVALPGALHPRGSEGGANLLLTSGQSQIDNPIASSLFASLMAMALERLMIHPIETTYLTQQKNGVNFLKAARSILSQKGCLGFYSGLKLMLYSALPLNLSLFGVYTATLNEMKQRGFSYVASNTFAGVACSFTSSLILSPVESMRLRQTYHMPPIHSFFYAPLAKDTCPYSTDYAYCKQTMKQYYYGYHYVLVRMLLFGTLTLSCSHAISRSIDPTNQYDWLPYVSTLGMGMLTTTVTTLIDNIRIQHFVDQERYQYISARAIYRHLSERGLLLNGLVPRWTRFTIGPAIIMGTTHLLLTGLSHGDESQGKNERKSGIYAL